MDGRNDAAGGPFGWFASREKMMTDQTQDPIGKRLRGDPISLACLAGVGVSIVLMSLTIWLA